MHFVQRMCKNKQHAKHSVKRAEDGNR